MDVFFNALIEMPSLYPSLFHTPSPSASPSLMVTSSAVPSSAHITTTFSSTAFPTNLQLSRPSAAPQVLFPTISPTPSTFYTSVLPCRNNKLFTSNVKPAIQLCLILSCLCFFVTVLPTLPPVSWAPTRLPSDSIAPPSQLPTVIASWIPTINSLEFLTFTASNVTI